MAGERHPLVAFLEATGYTGDDRAATLCVPSSDFCVVDIWVPSAANAAKP